MSYYFAIIGNFDNPIYEAEFGSYRQGNHGTVKFSPDFKEMNPFIVHSSLDVIEDMQWKSQQLYHSKFDNFYGYWLSSYITPGNVKLILLHEMKLDESIKLFFTDVYDLYVKTLMNPFYTANKPITSPEFDSRVRALVKKYL